MTMSDFSSLANVRAALPGLDKALPLACDWLANVAQVRSEQIEPESNPRPLTHTWWKGAFRGEYHPATKRWDVFCPIWHGGQAVKALCLAERATGDGRWRQTAVDGAEFILHNQVTKGPDAGLILAYEDLPDKVCSSAILESLDGLFHLSDLTGDTRFQDAAVAAVMWLRDHAWVRGEGILRDWYDPDQGKFIDPYQIAQDGSVGRPLVDDAVWLTAARRGGEPSLRAVFYEILERLLRDEHPAGNWVKYRPCQWETGQIHPRHAFWWGFPMIDAWRDTGDTRWLDVAIRSGQWYMQAQRLDGGLLRFTDLEFRTACFGHATSGIMSASVMWIELFKATAQTCWLEPLHRALDYACRMQFTQPQDPNLAGCILEKVLEPDGTDASPYYIRDLGTIFFIQAAAGLMLSAEGG